MGKLLECEGVGTARWVSYPMEKPTIRPLHGYGGGTLAGARMVHDLEAKQPGLKTF